MTTSDKSDRETDEGMHAADVELTPVGGDGWEGLSRRIARRTTDLIAIAVIAIAGVTIAQRLVVWWKTDPADTLANPEVVFSSDALAPWGVGSDGAALDLGDAPLTLHRKVTPGTREEAVKKLLEECTTYLAESTETVIIVPAVTPEESRLLERLREWPLAGAADDHRWAVYQVDGPVAMVFGTRITNEGGAAVRIACWGLVMPSFDNTWTLLRITPRPTAASASAADAIPLPQNCRPGLAVRDDVGGQLITFSGGGPPDSWGTHYDALALERDWTLLADWRTESNSWSAAWSAGSGVAAKRIDLQFTRTEQGWSGLLNVSPAGTGLRGAK